MSAGRHKLYVETGALTGIYELKQRYRYLRDAKENCDTAAKTPDKKSRTGMCPNAFVKTGDNVVYTSDSMTYVQAVNGPTLPEKQVPTFA
jgi:hypothetical protein